MAEMPSSSICANPTMNAWNAAAGSLSHSALNCSAVMPDTRAKSSNACPPVAAATSMLISALENAEPPISARTPTDDSAAAKPNICASLRPTWSPAAARRSDMFMMSASVVAKLLPRSTSVAPRLPNCAWSMLVMLANFASVEAASSATMLVELPRSIIVRVKSTR